MMELSKGQEVAALFDLDGVVFDTESQYSLYLGYEREDVPSRSGAF